MSFKNCTNDTLFIGASHFDNIDSVWTMVNPDFNPLTNNNIDTTGYSLWKGEIFGHDSFVLPDSTCMLEDFMPLNCDTFYFFLIKWRDAKRYSWDEIRDKKIFRKWMLIKDKEGKYERNINY